MNTRQAQLLVIAGIVAVTLAATLIVVTTVDGVIGQLAAVAFTALLAVVTVILP